jgi:hypothetical protein
VWCLYNLSCRSYAHLRGLYQEANIAHARQQLFNTAGGFSSGMKAEGSEVGGDRADFVMQYLETSSTT